MPRYFLDSSALVKRYHQEAGSAKVDSLFEAPSSRFIISRLAVVEFHSTSARLVREETLTPRDFGRLIARLEADVAAGLLAVAAVSSLRFGEAAALLGTLGLTSNLRALDSIHLATAQALHARSPLAAFVAADKKLLAVAANSVKCAVVDVG
jgi:predicted nucleic acid-binding protein